MAENRLYDDDSIQSLSPLEENECLYCTSNKNNFCVQYGVHNPNFNNCLGDFCRYLQYSVPDSLEQNF